MRSGGNSSLAPAPNALTAPHPPALLAIQEQSEGMGRYLCALIRSEGAERLEAVGARLLTRCWRITERVERITTGAATGGAVGALLDLGRCTADEAQQVSAPLLAWLRHDGWRAGVGIGPTLVSAELMALVALADSASPADTAVEAPSITPIRLTEWLSGLPVPLLARLDPERALDPDAVARLLACGLRTLGQVARVDARDPQALRRQYGAAAGARLAALCQGVEIRPLQPEQRAVWVTRHRVFAPPATADEALAALPTLAHALAQRLLAHGRQGRHLQLRVVWESGAVTRARRRLARPLYQSDALAQAAAGLLISLLRARDSVAPAQQLESLTLALGDLSAQPLAQPRALFSASHEGSARPTKSQATLERIALEVAEPLARRYGAPALYRLTLSQPDAILPEERTQRIGLTAAQVSQGAQPATGARDARPTRATKVHRDETQSVQAPQPHWW